MSRFTSTKRSSATPEALTSTYGAVLRRLYLVRFAFAVVWAALVFLAPNETGPLLTALLVVYPLFDAGAVLWQLRSDPDAGPSKAAEKINVAVSGVVALALGVASISSIAVVLAVWGAWAIGSGIPQLITAIRNRRSGGQVAQMLSGGISVLAGGSFLAQSVGDGGSTRGIAGYATLGGIFFLISAVRLGASLRKRGGMVPRATVAFEETGSVQAR